jgi:quercetin dioxygenase-like cupin family protein
MKILPAGSRATRKAPAAWFTGDVWQDAVIETEAPARLRAVVVHFSPGARTHWHTHPLGQTLLITAGSGRVQSRGGPVRIVRPGDVVWIPPGEMHWHGAGPETGMTHVAMHEAEGGSSADWFEPVADADYLSEPG